MRKNRVRGGVVVVAIAMRPMETNHAENAATSRRGSKRWNYLWTPILRTIRTPRAVEGVAVVVDEGDNQLDVVAGWFSITRS
jgi:small neutral amino acid transporter SnatA (MarC family)